MPRANAYVIFFLLACSNTSHTTQGNASAREKRRPIQKKAVASSSRPPNSNVSGKLLATGCFDNNIYTLHVSAIVREPGLDDLLLDQRESRHSLYVTLS